MKRWNHMLLFCAVLTALLCATAYATDNARPVQIPYQPTISDGRPIHAETLEGLEEITVPVRVSLESPTETMFFALFYNGDGKFIGEGMTAATVDSQTSFVIMPVQSGVTGAETLKMLVTDTAFRPLSDAENYSLTGGGGGGSGGGFPYNPPPAATYYLRAAADIRYENGGYGSVYLTETEPAPDMALSGLASSSDALFQREVRAYGYSFTYYVILNPGEGSALAYPRIIQGNANGAQRVNVTLNEAPSAVIYRISAWSAATDDNAPTVTLKSAFHGNGSGGGSSSGGGGGSSSGGGGSSSGSSVMTYYYARANVNAVYENGGSGYAYLSQSYPVDGMTLPLMSDKDSKTFLSMTPNVMFYVIFAPGENSELAEPPALTGSGSMEKVGAVAVNFADGGVSNAVAYRVTTQGGFSPANVPPVDITGAFRGIGGGGGAYYAPLTPGL